MPDRSSGRDARNAALLLVAEVVGKASTFAFTIVAARELSHADFGAFNYAVAFAMLAATVPSWGFNAVLVREASQDPDRLPTLFSEALAWRTGLLVPTLAIAAAIGIATRPNPASTQALLLVLLAAACDVYTDTAKAAASVTGQLRGWALALVANRVISAGVGAALLLSGRGVVAAALGYLSGSALGAIAAMRSVLVIGVRPQPGAVRRAGMSVMGRRSLALGIDTLVATALFRLDSVVLAAMKGDAAVADYTTAYRLIEAVLFVTWSLNAVTLPRASAARHDADVRRVTETAVGAIAALFVPFGVLLLVRGPDVVGLVFGHDYKAASSGAIRWLSGAPILFAAGYFASAALISRGRNTAVLVASSIAAVFNLAANLALIPHFGVTAAGAVTTVSYAVEMAVLLTLCKGTVGLLRMDRAVAVPVAASVPLALVLVLVDGPVLAVAAAGGVVYLVAWWWAVRRLRPEVVQVLTSAVRRSAR